MSLCRFMLLMFGLGLLVLFGASGIRTVNAEGGSVNVVVASLADTSGTCSQQGSGTCTLRDAITFANAKGGASPVNVTFSISGFINLTSNLPNIKFAMTIDGSGQVVTISGQGAYRVFTVGKNATITLKALSMQNGNGETDCGSAYSCGGAIKNRGTLTVLNSYLIGNYADYTGGGIFNAGGTLSVSDTTFNNNTTSEYYGLGGAIYNAGALTINDDSSFNGNTAFSGGAIYHQFGALTLDDGLLSQNSADFGGVIYNLGELDVTDSQFLDHELDQSATGTHGGAIYNHGGTLTVNNSTFSGNSTSPFGYGGAISNDGTMSVKNSTVWDNYAEYGGGIYNLTGTATVAKSTLGNNTGWGGGGALYNDSGTLILSNSTITGNTNGGLGNGGGIYNFDGSLYMTNSTIWGNTAAPLIHHAGGIYNDGDLAALQNTIVGNNSGYACYDYADSMVADYYNLDDDGSCADATEKTVAQIALLPLANNGGPTQTMKPGAKSAARNAGDNSVCADAVGYPKYGAGGKDQRGVTRPQGPSCDVGAYEVKAK